MNNEVVALKKTLERSLKKTPERVCSGDGLW